MPVIPPYLQRLALLTGAEGIEALSGAGAMIVGLGGVGSWCAEALVRSGIGRLCLVDSDTVCVTNINRQAQATAQTVGRLKTEALRERLLQIHPAARIEIISAVFARPLTPAAGNFQNQAADNFQNQAADNFQNQAADNFQNQAADNFQNQAAENIQNLAAGFPFAAYPYIIDAIDSLTSKLDLIEMAFEHGKTLYASMGMAQKLDPTRLRAASIWQTRGCPLARLVRQGLRKRGFSGDFTAVFSDERLPLHQEITAGCGTAGCLCPKNAAHEWCSSKKVINGSAVTVTAAAGMILASLVIQDALKPYQNYTLKPQNDT